MESCLRMETFRKEIIKTVNSSNLTVGAVYFIMKDVLNELRSMYLEEIEKDKERIKKPMVQEEVIPLVEIENSDGTKTMATLEEVSEYENQNND